MPATQGTAPLTLAFTDTSTGDELDYYWDFGDGNTSTLKNPTHTYVNQGFYSCILTVTNINGSNQASEPIVVNPAGSSSGYGGGNGIGHYLYSTSISTWIAHGSGAANLYYGSTLSAGTWYNLVFQRDYGVAFNWYLNGQNINNYSSNYLTTALSSPNSTIAKHYNSTSYNFNGKIPIVHVYNRALTATEVSQNYNAAKGRFGL